jgi:hypothetical protein
MTTLYLQTAAVALALIVMPITIFVFGVSMLGRALKRAQEREQGLLEAKRVEEQKGLEQYKDDLGKAVSESKTTGTLGHRIDEIKRKLSRSERLVKHTNRQIAAVRSGPKCLTVSNCVIAPVLLLVVCFALAHLAAGLDSSSILPQGKLITHAPLVLWLLGLASAVVGVVGFVLPSLYKIQEVAVQSDEVFQKSTVEAMMTALERHEEARKPELVMNPETDSFAVAPVAGSDFKLNFVLFLSRGFVGQHCSVLFFSHGGEFQFPKKVTWVQTSGRFWPGALTTRTSFDRLQRGINQPLELSLTAPSQPGVYELGYQVFCDGFRGDLQTFPVTVKSAEVAKS